MMAFSSKPWSAPSVEDFGGDAAKYCAACLIDMNDGSAKTAGKCKLPIKEPSGDVNMAAMRAASGVLAGARGGVDAPADMKKKAASKLMRLMAQAKMTPGEHLQRMAGM